MSKTLSELRMSLPEKDEHKMSKEYKKLSPKMQKAVDEVFGEMDSKPANFLNTFDKTITNVAKKFRVPEKQLLDYFEREVLSVM